MCEKERAFLWFVQSTRKDAEGGDWVSATINNRSPNNLNISFKLNDQGVMFYVIRVTGTLCSSCNTKWLRLRLITWTWTHSSASRASFWVIPSNHLLPVSCYQVCHSSFCSFYIKALSFLMDHGNTDEDHRWKGIDLRNLGLSDAEWNTREEGSCYLCFGIGTRAS